MTQTETQNEVQRYATLLEKYVKGASMPDFQEDMILEAAGHLRRLDAENKAHKADVMSFHYAMKDAGWHPGRTDDLLTDIIRAKGKELIQVHAENSQLREALERARSWMDRQSDSQSGGSHATFDLMMLREERDAMTMALQDVPVAPDCDRDDCDKYGCTGACDPDAAMAANAEPIALPEPAAWTLQSELDAKRTTTSGHLWFTNPGNCLWTALYTEHQLRNLLPAMEALTPVQALLDAHAELLDANPYAYFELAYTRQTGWMAWITDKPFHGPVINPDRKVLARGQGSTPAEACAAAQESP